MENWPSILLATAGSIQVLLESARRFTGLMSWLLEEQIWRAIYSRAFPSRLRSGILQTRGEAAGKEVLGQPLGAEHGERGRLEPTTLPQHLRGQDFCGLQGKPPESAALLSIWSGLAFLPCENVEFRVLLYKRETACLGLI